MKPITVWFNKHLSNTWHALRVIREVQRPCELRVLCTHTNRRYPGSRYSDYFEPEPRHNGDSEYVEYCLEFVKKRQVDLFYPWRRLFSILRAKERFAELGTTLLTVGDLNTLRILESKAEQYRVLGSDVAPLPDYRVVNTLEQFDAAFAELRTRQKNICYKPAVSIYGIGFHILSESKEGRQRWLGGDPVLIPVEEARRTLGTKKQPFADLLLMQHLPGPERSIDCLAVQGKLLRCVIRRKSMKNHRRQTIEDNPAIEEIARRITDKLCLNAVFNIQLRNEAETPYLLEINPRMSGGIPAACQSGLALPYWAIRLALGTVSHEQIPFPQTGLKVDSTSFEGSR